MRIWVVLVCCCTVVCCGETPAVMPTGHDPNDPNEPTFVRVPLPDDIKPTLDPTLLPGYKAADDHRPIDPFDSSEPQRQMRVSGAFDRLGNADAGKIREALAAIASRVQLKTVVPEQSLIAPSDPRGGTGWRLWIYWAPDVAVPPIAGQIPEIRKAGFSVYQVPIISLRQWEAMMRGMFARRDRIIAALQAALASKDRMKAEVAAMESNQWVVELGPMRLLLDAVAPKGISLVPDVASADLLFVTEIPCYRLISPRGRVHMLSGTSPHQDLLEFCMKARSWEESHDADLTKKGW